MNMKTARSTLVVASAIVVGATTAYRASTLVAAGGPRSLAFVAMPYVVRGAQLIVTAAAGAAIARRVA